MKTDLASRADIDQLMVLFYGRAMSDPVIGYLFTDVAKLDLEHHLPVIGDFWESVIFGRNVYARHARHPLQIHAELNELSPLEPHHFGRWLVLFTGCVDELFSGAAAEFIKQRAQMIASRMQQFVAATA